MNGTSTLFKAKYSLSLDPDTSGRARYFSRAEYRVTIISVTDCQSKVVSVNGLDFEVMALLRSVRIAARAVADISFRRGLLVLPDANRSIS
jgi:hypothetical protein